MVGSGVIDLEAVRQLQSTFAVLSQIIDYPEGEFPETENAELQSLINELRQFDLIALQEKYSTLFELNKRLTLYMTYYRFEDSRERGTILAKLKMLYEMFGVSLDKAELTDYLPAMLEFLAVADFEGEAGKRVEDLKLLFSVLEDGTYELLQHAKEFEEEPYIRLIHLIRIILRKCIINKKEEVAN